MKVPVLVTFFASQVLSQSDSSTASGLTIASFASSMSPSSTFSRVSSTSVVVVTSSASIMSFPLSSTVKSNSSRTIRPTATGPYSFTSVHTTIRTSQATCLKLPTPTPRVREIPLQGMVYNVSNPATWLRTMYLGSDGQLKYVASLGTDKNTYIFDFSDPKRVGMADLNGNTIYITDSGVHLSSVDCKYAYDFEIDNFADQLATGSTSIPPPPRSLVKRFKEADFFVVAKLTNQCKKVVKDLTPSLFVGPTPCNLAPGSIEGQYIFNCQFPGENSGEMKCEADVTRFLEAVTAGIVGSATNWSTVSKMVWSALEKTIGKQTLLAIALAAGIAGGPELFLLAEAMEALFTAATGALAVLELALTAYNEISQHGLAQDICMQIHQSEFPLPLTLRAGTSNAVLTRLGAAPSTSQEYTTQINDPRETSCSTCNNSGHCDDFTNCNGGFDCKCGTSTEGINFCFSNEWCNNLKTCAATIDCPEGTKCIVASCCPKNVCVHTEGCVVQPQRRRFSQLMSRIEMNATSGLSVTG